MPAATSAFSTTSTRRPRCAASSMTPQPVMPPPATTRSNGCGEAGEGARAEGGVEHRDRGAGGLSAGRRPCAGGRRPPAGAVGAVEQLLPQVGRALAVEAVEVALGDLRQRIARLAVAARRMVRQRQLPRRPRLERTEGLATDAAPPARHREHGAASTCAPAPACGRRRGARSRAGCGAPARGSPRSPPRGAGRGRMSGDQGQGSRR